MDSERTGNYFCYLEYCDNYCGNFDSVVYKEFKKSYEDWKYETDTDYYPSDVEFGNANDPRNIDRVWGKIIDMKEDEESFSGEYIYDYIWYDLYDRVKRDYDLLDDLKNEIRNKFRYKMSKKNFIELCQKYENIHGSQIQTRLILIKSNSKLRYFF